MKVTVPYFFKAYWKDYAWGVLFLLLTNLLAASIPMIVKHIIEAIQATQAEQAAWLLGSIGIIIIVMFVIRVYSRYFLLGVGRKVELDMRMRMFRHLLSLPRSFYDVQQTGELMSRLTNDLTALRMFLGGGVMLIVNVIFAYAIVLPLMASLSLRLTVFAFLLYPVVIGLMRFLGTRVKQLSHAVQDQLGDVTALAQENFSGISIIQSYAKEAEESARFRDASMGYLDANVRLVKIRALFYVLIAMMSGLSLLMVMTEGGREVITQELQLSGFAAFMLYLERLAWPTVSLGWILSTFQQGLAAKERINTLLQYQPTITDRAANLSIQSVPQGPLTLKNLSFHYENPYVKAPEGMASPRWVLQDISFAVQPGEMVAVVGPIGSGKTTLLNLIARLYDPPPESIFIGNVPVERIPMAVLRQDVALMPQNSFLFSATVEENIVYGNPESHFENMADASRIARIHDEIMAFPKAYETPVGERGVTLSGGQRQRSALARTLLLTPRLLLLDDPFSSVDVETEAQIIAGLQERRILKDKTTLFASQRFSLVRQADRILVLNNQGHIEAIGSHETLLQQSELYRALNKLDEESQAAVQEGEVTAG